MSNSKRGRAMSAVTVSDEHATSNKAKVIQPAWVRALHWTNAFAMVLMIMSGWQIYNASPLFGFNFPSSITLGGWLAGALLWHFAAMWLLMVNGLIYLAMGFATGRSRTLHVRDAIKTMPDLTRRRFISGGASLGALTLLTGCDVTDSFSAEEMLKQVSKFNDGVQAWMFNPNALAPTFSESEITKPFPFNAYYDLDEAPEVDGKAWKLGVRGLVENKKSWT